MIWKQRDSTTCIETIETFDYTIHGISLTDHCTPFPRSASCLWEQRPLEDGK